MQTRYITAFLNPKSPSKSDLFVFNFGNIDAKRAIDSSSSKSSIKNSSSGILEVLHNLEAEDGNQTEHGMQAKSSSTQSHPNLLTNAGKTKRFALKSLLKRTHSAPKKLYIEKNKTDEGKNSSCPPTFCHSFMEKLKNVADKHLCNKLSSQEKHNSIKTIHLSDDQKILIPEQTGILRLKSSPKTGRRSIAAYLGDQNIDDILQIIELDESPSESRKRRDRQRASAEQYLNFIASNVSTDANYHG